MIDDILFIVLPRSWYERFCPLASKARDLAYREGYLDALQRNPSQSLFKSMLITEVKQELRDLHGVR